MSPEQIRGMPVDARTDIFSAGIILHEMLTTEKLFRGDTEFALMEKVRKAEVPPPSKFNRRVPAELDAIAARALARDVSDRYQSAADFAADLDKLLVSYRFDPSELKEFVRGLFRSDFAKEEEDLRACRAALPPGERATAAELAHAAPAPIPTQAAPASVTPAPPPGGADEDRRGFWAKMKAKFKKG
jgi:serine/threonine protein kinase